MAEHQASSNDAQSFFIVDVDNPVVRITLNRPHVLNSLSKALVQKLTETLLFFDRQKDIRAIVLTGSEKAFAAGADISEMVEMHTASMLEEDFLIDWETLRHIKKPLIAAVDGYVLGGGMELMMACDIVVASEKARFAQPEIRLGVMPGAGGTQRLTRYVGTKRALYLLLTGDTIGAEEAYRLGLVSHIVPQERTVSTALHLAKRIASMPSLAVHLIKQAVYMADDVPLEAGLRFERHAFYSLFATEDQKEGMRAFTEKRQPHFTGN